MLKNNLQKKSEFSSNKKAFTVLFAVIVSSLILALGLGIVAITMKEVKLSGAGRDSQVAFYAADSGLECAEYFDITQSAFATSTSDEPVNPIVCNVQNITVTADGDGAAATSTFQMCMKYKDDKSCDTSKPCAEVTVAKYIEGGVKKTNIDSRGYNTCDPANQRRLERGYSVEYNSEW
jgi:Tfp pilus assembly protein PilX